MAEKIIHEVRVVETDDGFRIEVKGDKEHLKEMGFGHGFGPGMAHRWMHRSHRRGGRRRGFGPMHHGFGPWWWHEEPVEGEEPATDV
jgi:hypothetical protein